MANRLTKLANIQYTPASPYVPGVEAYCVGGNEWAGSGWAAASTPYSGERAQSSLIELEDGGLYSPTTGYIYYPAAGESVTAGGYLGPAPVSNEVCYPAVAAKPAVPAVISYSSIAGWNGGASSIEPLEGDGYFSFNVSPNPAAVVVGLVAHDESVLPSEVTHGFYVHGDVVEVMESGAVIATAPTAHATDKRLVIARGNGVVTYQYDGWSHTSEVASFGAQYLDVSIYASGDFVDNPQRGGVGYGGVVLPPLAFLGGDVSAWSQGGIKLPRLEMRGSGLVGTAGGGGVVLPNLLMRGANHDGAEGGVTLPQLSLYGTGGYPAPQLQYGAMAIPPLVFGGSGLAGTVGSGGITLPRLLQRGANHDDGQGGVTLPQLRLLGLARPVLDYGLASSTLALAARAYGHAPLTAKVESTLQLSDAVSLSVIVDGVVYDTLSLSDQAFGYQLLTAVAQSTLLLGDSAGSAAALQHAVNVLTGAITTYSGFDFNSFALADNGAYAARSDGLYRMRAGDDDGAPISVAIDFGSTDYDTTKAKTVESVFFGLSTDGDVLATLRCDGVDRSYRLTRRGDLMRATAAKGVSGRRWNLTLEVAEATEFELDAVEHVVSVAARRSTR